MNSKRISFRSLCVSALLAVLLVSAIPAAYGNDWGDLEKEYDNLGHDWEHRVERACLIVCVSVFLFERIDA